MEINPTEEWIRNNFDTTLKLLSDPLLSNVKALIEANALEYSLSPASSRREYSCSFPGGLCFHNLHVLKWLKKFSSVMTDDKEFSIHTLIKLSVLHEIGKMGTYVRNDGDYFDKNGHYYSINPNLQYMKVPDRSLRLCNEFDVRLTEEEFLAIKLSDVHDEENKQYRYKEPKLALVLQNAVAWSRKLEKDLNVRWPK